MTTDLKSKAAGKPKIKEGCKGYYDSYFNDFDCEYETTIECEECKYGSCGGRKDPAAKCNQLTPE